MRKIKIEILNNIIAKKIQDINTHILSREIIRLKAEKKCMNPGQKCFLNDNNTHNRP